MFGNGSFVVFLLLFISLCSIPSIVTLRCYECLNCADETCPCDTLVEADAKDTYCALVRDNPAGELTFAIRRLPRNSTDRYESNPYFISVEEWISYDQVADKWVPQIKTVTFGCQTDGCNRPELRKALPENGLSLGLPSDWLNDNLRRKPGQTATSCHDCPEEPICGDKPNYVDPSRCPITQCDEVCAMDQTVRKGQTAPFCYELFCVPSESQPPAVYLSGVYYINNGEFELVETDIVCAAANCTRLEIFQDVKDKLQKDYTGIKPFLPGNSANSISLSAMIILTVISVQTRILG